MVVGAIVGIVVGVITRNPYAGFAVFSAIAGVGSALFPATSSTPPPAPGSLSVQTSQYGLTIPVLYGTRKLSGNCLWYDNFKSSAQYAEAGKGGGSSQVTGYTYSVSLAFGLCLIPEGATVSLQRMWYGKEELDLAKWLEQDKIRFYDGTQTEPDSHWSQFVDRPPVLKRFCYVVLPNFDLGNSSYLNQLRFEVGTAVYRQADLFVEEETIVNGEPTEPDGEIGKRVSVNTSNNEIVAAEMVWGTGEYGYSYIVTRKSTDFGETWGDPVPVVTDTDSEWLMNDIQYDGGYHWLAVYRFEDWIKLWKSTDGETWVLVNTIDIASIAEVVWPPYGPDMDDISLTVAGNYVAISGPGVPLAIWHSSDGGATFGRTDIGATYPAYPQYYWYPVVQARSDGTIICVCYLDLSATDWDSNFIILRSTDGGASFIKVHDFSHYLTSNYFDESFQVANDGDMWVVTSKWLSVDRCSILDDEDMKDGDAFAILVSKDNGVTWEALETPFKYVETTAEYTGYCQPSLSLSGGVVFYSMWYEIYKLPSYQTSGTYRKIWSYKDGRWNLLAYYRGETTYFLGTLGTMRGYVDPNGDTRVVLYDGKIANRDSAVWEANTAYTIIFTPDVYPTDVTEDILIDDFYGMGLDSGYLDAAAYAATTMHCAANDHKVSMLFNSQASVLDALQEVINHHQGYITYSDGKIAHKQFKQETPSVTLTNGIDLVQKDNELPVQISKAGARGYQNRITVEWTKRDKEYVVGTVQAEDIVDIDTYGLLDSSVNLSGLCTFARANKMAYLMLKKSLLAPLSISFRVGPKSLELKPGDVVALSDPQTELDAQAIRVMAVREGDDYIIEVDAQQEGILGDYTVVAGQDSTYDDVIINDDIEGTAEQPDMSADPGNVYQLRVHEVMSLYASTSALAFCYSPSGFENWAGAALYRSYDGSTYSRVGSSNTKGSSGYLYAIGADYIRVYLYNTGITLSSAETFDALIRDPKKNLLALQCGVEITYVKYQTAMLISAGMYQLSGLIVGLEKIPRVGGSVSTLDFALYGSTSVTLYAHIGQFYACGPDDKFRTLYFKLASINAAGVEQAVSDVFGISEYVDDLVNKPRPPQNITVNGVGITTAGTARISASADVVFTWVSQNRFGAGRSNFTRSDAVTEDVDFSTFVIEIYSGTTLKRTSTSTAKTWTYDTTMQTADSFLTGAITAKLYQRNTLQDSVAATITVTRV
jgi:hypothetical protein